MKARHLLAWLLSGVVLLIPCNSDHTGHLSDTNAQEYAASDIKTNFKKELKYLRDFRDKVGRYSSRTSCIRDCKVQVCEKTAATMPAADRDEHLTYCATKVCEDRICSKITDQQCYDAMSRKNAFKTVTLSGCVKVCGCDLVIPPRTKSNSQSSQSSTIENSGTGNFDEWSYDNLTDKSEASPTQIANAPASDEDSMWMSMMRQFTDFAWSYIEPYDTAHLTEMVQDQKPLKVSNFSFASDFILPMTPPKKSSAAVGSRTAKESESKASSESTTSLPPTTRNILNNDGPMRHAAGSEESHDHEDDLSVGVPPVVSSTDNISESYINSDDYSEGALSSERLANSGSSKVSQDFTEELLDPNDDPEFRDPKFRSSEQNVAPRRQSQSKFTYKVGMKKKNQDGITPNATKTSTRPQKKSEKAFRSDMTSKNGAQKELTDNNGNTTNPIRKTQTHSKQLEGGSASLSKDMSIDKTKKDGGTIHVDPDSLFDDDLKLNNNTNSKDFRTMDDVVFNTNVTAKESSLTENSTVITDPKSKSQNSKPPNTNRKPSSKDKSKDDALNAAFDDDESSTPSEFTVTHSSATKETKIATRRKTFKEDGKIITKSETAKESFSSDVSSHDDQIVNRKSDVSKDSGQDSTPDWSATGNSQSQDGEGSAGSRTSTRTSKTTKVISSQETIVSVDESSNSATPKSTRQKTDSLDGDKISNGQTAASSSNENNNGDLDGSALDASQNDPATTPKTKSSKQRSSTQLPKSSTSQDFEADAPIQSDNNQSFDDGGLSDSPGQTAGNMDSEDLQSTTKTAVTQKQNAKDGLGGLGEKDSVNTSKTTSFRSEKPSKADVESEISRDWESNDDSAAKEIETSLKVSQTSSSQSAEDDNLYGLSQDDPNESQSSSKKTTKKSQVSSVRQPKDRDFDEAKEVSLTSETTNIEKAIEDLGRDSLYGDEESDDQLSIQKHSSKKSSKVTTKSDTVNNGEDDAILNTENLDKTTKIKSAHESDGSDTFGDVTINEKTSASPKFITTRLPRKSSSTTQAMAGGEGLEDDLEGQGTAASTLSNIVKSSTPATALPLEDDLPLESEASIVTARPTSKSNKDAVVTTVAETSKASVTLKSDAKESVETFENEDLTTSTVTSLRKGNSASKPPKAKVEEAEISPDWESLDDSETNEKETGSLKSSTAASTKTVDNTNLYGSDDNPTESHSSSKRKPKKSGQDLSSLDVADVSESVKPIASDQGSTQNISSKKSTKDAKTETTIKGDDVESSQDNLAEQSNTERAIKPKNRLDVEADMKSSSADTSKVNEVSVSPKLLSTAKPRKSSSTTQAVAESDASDEDLGSTFASTTISGKSSTHPTDLPLEDELPLDDDATGVTVLAPTPSTTPKSRTVADVITKRPSRATTPQPAHDDPWNSDLGPVEERAAESSDSGEAQSQQDDVPVNKIPAFKPATLVKSSTSTDSSAAVDLSAGVNESPPKPSKNVDDSSDISPDWGDEATSVNVKPEVYKVSASKSSSTTAQQSSKEDRSGGHDGALDETEHSQHSGEVSDNNIEKAISSTNEGNNDALYGSGLDSSQDDATSTPKTPLRKQSSGAKARKASAPEDSEADERTESAHAVANQSAEDQRDSGDSATTEDKSVDLQKPGAAKHANAESVSQADMGEGGTSKVSTSKSSSSALQRVSRKEAPVTGNDWDSSLGDTENSRHSNKASNDQGLASSDEVNNDALYGSGLDASQDDPTTRKTTLSKQRTTQAPETNSSRDFNADAPIQSANADSGNQPLNEGGLSSGGLSDPPVRQQVIERTDSHVEIDSSLPPPTKHPEKAVKELSMEAKSDVMTSSNVVTSDPLPSTDRALTSSPSLTTASSVTAPTNGDASVISADGSDQQEKPKKRVKARKKKAPDAELSTQSSTDSSGEPPNSGTNVAVEAGSGKGDSGLELGSGSLKSAQTASSGSGVANLTSKAKHTNGDRSNTNQTIATSSERKNELASRPSVGTGNADGSASNNEGGSGSSGLGLGGNAGSASSADKQVGLQTAEVATGDNSGGSTSTETESAPPVTIGGGSTSKGDSTKSGSSNNGVGLGLGSRSASQPNSAQSAPSGSSAAVSASSGNATNADVGSKSSPGLSVNAGGKNELASPPASVGSSGGSESASSNGGGGGNGSGGVGLGGSGGSTSSDSKSVSLQKPEAAAGAKGGGSTSTKTDAGQTVKVGGGSRSNEDSSLKLNPSSSSQKSSPVGVSFLLPPKPMDDDQLDAMFEDDPPPTKRTTTKKHPTAITSRPEKPNDEPYDPKFDPEQQWTEHELHSKIANPELGKLEHALDGEKDEESSNEAPVDPKLYSSSVAVTTPATSGHLLYEPVLDNANVALGDDESFKEVQNTNSFKSSNVYSDGSFNTFQTKTIKKDNRTMVAGSVSQTQNKIETKQEYDSAVSSYAMSRRKRAVIEGDTGMSNSNLPERIASDQYSYCSVASIGSKYEGFKCKKDCYSKCSPGVQFHDQCMDSCILIRCSIAKNDEDGRCADKCEVACKSEFVLKSQGTNGKVNSKVCSKHVENALFDYGETFRRELTLEYCQRPKPTS